MKKRIICAALALAMVLSLCGCGSDGKYKVVKSLGSQIGRASCRERV